MYTLRKYNGSGGYLYPTVGSHCAGNVDARDIGSFPYASLVNKLNQRLIAHNIPAIAYDYMLLPGIVNSWNSQVER
jgi:hypothetical protein